MQKGKQKVIIAEEVGHDKFSVDGKTLTKAQVELLHKIMPGSQLVWLVHYTKKKPWEIK
jgi:hypothetical protein